MEARFLITAHTVQGMYDTEVFGAPLDAQRVGFSLMEQAGDFYLMLDRRNGQTRRFNFDGQHMSEEG